MHWLKTVWVTMALGLALGWPAMVRAQQPDTRVLSGCAKGERITLWLWPPHGTKDLRCGRTVTVIKWLFEGTDSPWSLVRVGKYQGLVGRDYITPTDAEKAEEIAKRPQDVPFKVLGYRTVVTTQQHTYGGTTTDCYETGTIDAYGWGGFFKDDMQCTTTPPQITELREKHTYYLVEDSSTRYVIHCASNWLTGPCPALQARGTYLGHIKDNGLLLSGNVGRGVLGGVEEAMPKQKEGSQQ